MPKTNLNDKTKPYEILGTTVAAVVYGFHPRCLRESPEGVVKPSRQCYVYVQLPGEHTMFTAGKYRLDTNGRQRVGRFVYGQSYLARPGAVELDPIELPSIRRTYETAAFGGTFGALRDARTPPSMWRCWPRPAPCTIPSRSPPPST